MVRVVALVVVLAILLIAACKGGKPAKKDAAVTAADPVEVARALDKKCIGGDLEACRNLGVMHGEGIGVPKDSKRATALFAQACNGKHLSACNHLALALAEGIGVEKDPARAIEIYEQACTGGYRLACRNLALMLRDGRGVPVDLERAAKLLDEACKGKVPFACTNAGDVDAMLAAKGGAEATARWKSSIAHYQQGCEAGDATGCRQIGIAYLEARGLPKSTTAASVWFERACVAEDAIACRILGAMLVDGVGVPQNAKRGQELLTRACDRKDDEACRLMKIAAHPAAGDAGVPNALSDASMPLTAAPDAGSAAMPR